VVNGLVVTQNRGAGQVACSAAERRSKVLDEVSIAILGGAAAENVKLSGRGLYADKPCMIKNYVKAETFKNRSVAPDPLQRFLGNGGLRWT